MGYDPVDYWAEALASSFEEHGVEVTQDVLKLIAEDISISHENYGMAFYSPPAGEHLSREISDLERKLKIEREKVHCKRCNGSGTITTYGPYHSATSSCWKCNGEGRHVL